MHEPGSDIYVRRLILPPLTVALVALLAIGCTAPGPVELAATDTGGSVTLEPDQELVVTLEGNPTTGYQWEIDGALPEMLEQEGEPSYAADSDAIGSGGVQTWRFRAVSKGEGELRMKYWRSFEPTTAPLDTFSVDVAVR